MSGAGGPMFSWYTHLDESSLRRPEFRAHRWVRLGDGTGWALPSLAPVDFLMHPELGEAVARCDAGFDAIPDLEPSEGPAAIEATLARADLVADYVRAFVGVLVPKNYFVETHQARLMLPLDPYGIEFGEVADVIIAMVEEATAGGPVLPLGWDANQGVIFSN